jgi:hypothetical protein
MPRVGKRLHDLQIDEISLVDRPANQHGVVAIAKRAEEAPMTYYDADGYEVDENAIEVGDVVYDADGQEFAMLGADELDELGLDPDELLTEDDGGTAYLEEDPEEGRVLAGVGKRYGARQSVGKRGARLGGPAQRSGRGQRQSVNKSIGQTVLEQLSKAYGDDERHELIAKAFDMAASAQAQNNLLTRRIAKMEAERDLTSYVELADEYELPVDPTELGPVLKRMADSLPPEDLELVDRIFSAAGSGALFDELGSNGVGASNVMDQISAMAFQAVGKGDTQLSPEAAVGAIFDANPAAYDEYLREGRI